MWRRADRECVVCLVCARVRCFYNVIVAPFLFLLSVLFTFALAHVCFVDARTSTTQRARTRTNPHRYLSIASLRWRPKQDADGERHPSSVDVERFSSATDPNGWDDRLPSLSYLRFMFLAEHDRLRPWMDKEMQNIHGAYVMSC